MCVHVHGMAGVSEPCNLMAAACEAVTNTRIPVQVGSKVLPVCMPVVE